MTGDRGHLSIGEVLSLLQDEFPDVTISKIRFLESQGLLDPERTPSGYRKFYPSDVRRLRWILTEQRDKFLPLKVIKDRLDEGIEAELAAPDPSGNGAAAAIPPTQEAGRARRGGRPSPAAADPPVRRGSAAAAARRRGRRRCPPGAGRGGRRRHVARRARRHLRRAAPAADLDGRRGPGQGRPGPRRAGRRRGGGARPARGQPDHGQPHRRRGARGQRPGALAAGLAPGVRPGVGPLARRRHRTSTGRTSSSPRRRPASSPGASRPGTCGCTRPPPSGRRRCSSSSSCPSPGSAPPRAGQEARDTLAELAGLGQGLRAALLRVALADHR